MSNDTIPALGANTLPDGESDRLRSLIEAWTDDWVGGEMAEWETFWTEEPVLMPPGQQRIAGAGKLADYVTQSFQPGLRYRFSDWSFTGREDLAVVTNQIALSSDAAGTLTFNQMIVLRRDSEQRWRIQTVIFTPTAA